MLDIAELNEEQAWIGHLIANLLNSAESEVADAASVAMLRWDLVKALSNQRARVEEHVCRPILASSDVLATRAVWAHRQNGPAIQDALMRFVAAWPVSRLSAEWEDFREAAEVALQPISEHLAWQERELFVHAARLSSRRAA